MIQLGRIEDSEETDLDKTDKSKECKICHCNYFDDGSKSDSTICNRCDWRIKPFGNFTIIHVNDFSYRFFMLDITEEDLIEFIKDFELDDEFETLLRYERIDISERIDKNKQVYQENVCFVITGTLKILNLSLSQIFVLNVILDVTFQKQITLQY